MAAQHRTEAQWGTWAPAAVKKRLEEAADVIRDLKGIDWPEQHKSSWPAMLPSFNDVHDGLTAERVGRPARQGSEIDRAWQAFGWLNYLELPEKRLVWAKCNGFQWWQVMQMARLRSEYETRKTFADALKRIARGLNVNGPGK